VKGVAEGDIATVCIIPHTGMRPPSVTGILSPFYMINENNREISFLSFQKNATYFKNYSYKIG